jgi:hypothetical protein
MRTSSLAFISGEENECGMDSWNYLEGSPSKRRNPFEENSIFKRYIHHKGLDKVLKNFRLMIVNPNIITLK